MTHADYVAQGYPERYAVSDVYEETHRAFCVDVYDWSKPKGKTVIKGIRVSTVWRAEEAKKELEAEIAEWEVEVNEDDPQADYERTEMAALKAKIV